MHKRVIAVLRYSHILLLLITTAAIAQKFDTLGLGWSKTSVNAVIFRKNSLTTFNDKHYASYYDTAGFVVVAMQDGDGAWETVRTDLKGNVADAHNSISMIADGEGYIHLAWDHHNTKLKYCRSKKPGLLEFNEPTTMTGKNEDRVTYPEFYRMPDGGLIFLYRDGQSGQGNLVMNRYDVKKKKWKRVQQNLIDGENERNAYWQATVSRTGTIHISWVWREDPDVSTNHDLCYARSRDGGATWEKANGEKYKLPIRASDAEYAKIIPQQSDLINQTSMAATDDDHPVITTYWRENDSTIPQFFMVWYDGRGWRLETVSQRKTPFSLKGGGTKSIPVSRPLVLVKGKAKEMDVLVIYRDNERGQMVTFATRSSDSWYYVNEIPIADSAWEPSCDPDEFRDKRILRLFIQDVGQGDGEKLASKPPMPVVVMTLEN